MNTEQELLPCPFCGGDAFLDSSLPRRCHFIQCKKCGCGTQKHCAELDVCKQHLLEEWNRRAQPAVPEGYVLVPVEPTEAMLKAGGRERLYRRSNCAMYKAMIAAALKEQAHG